MSLLHTYMCLTIFLFYFISVFNKMSDFTSYSIFDSDSNLLHSHREVLSEQIVKHLLCLKYISRFLDRVYPYCIFDYSCSSSCIYCVAHDQECQAVSIVLIFYSLSLIVLARFLTDSSSSIDVSADYCLS